MINNVNISAHPMNLDLLAVVLCLLGSAFFSGSETALTSLPITRLEALRERCGSLTRKGLDRWADDPQGLLVTILIGNNLVNVLASALATKYAYSLSNHGSIAVVVGLLTLFILVFGEITPKTLSQAHAEYFSARVAPVLYVLDVVVKPLSRVLSMLARLLSPRQPSTTPVTEEDLRFMLRLAHRHAQLPPESRLMIESVLRFQQASAHEVMLPRPQVTTVDTSWTLAQLKRVINSSGHSRLPVIAGSPDEIVGVFHAKHLLALSPGQSWTQLVVPPLFIPESKPLPDLLAEFRSSGRHLAIVLDEFGGFAGVVTLEDALELVVGEIEDEFDQERESAVLTVPGGWVVPGYLSLRRLERIIQRELKQPEEIESVGGIVGSLADAGLSEAAPLTWDGLSIQHYTSSKNGPVRYLVRDIKRRKKRRPQRPAAEK